MKGRGVHWFVAWRYLMARPRRLSPAIVAVAAFFFAVSLVTSAIGGIVPESGPGMFMAPGAYEKALLIASLLVAVGVFVLLWVLVGYCRRYPEQLGVPGWLLGGLFLLAVGALAYGAQEATTHQIALVLLIVGGGCLVLGMRRYRRHSRGDGLGLLALAELMAGSGAAMYLIARYALQPTANPATPGAAWELLLILGLWIAGVTMSVLVGIRCLGAPSSSRWQRTAGQAARPAADRWVGPHRCGPLWLGAWLLLVASAVYAGFTHDPAIDTGPVRFYAPGGDYADYIQWMGLGLQAVGGLTLLIGIMSRQRRPRGRRVSVSVQLGVLGLTIGALGSILAGLLLAPSEQLTLAWRLAVIPKETFVLAAAACLVVAELALMLAAIRYVFTFFTTVSVAGVGIGSMALVIVLGVMSGFETDLRDKILGSNAHVLITTEDASFTEYRQVAERIQGIPGVVAHTPYLISEVVIAANNNYANVIIKGVDPNTVGDVTELDENADQPQALQRLYPLDVDGGIAGAAADVDAGAREARAVAPSAADSAPDSDVVDPPPADMQVDIDEAPMDLSGLGDPGPDRSPERAPSPPAGAPTPGGLALGQWGGDQLGDQLERSAVAGAWEPGSAGSGELDGTLDPPPADMRVDLDEPVDVSGSQVPQGPAVPGLVPGLPGAAEDNAADGEAADRGLEPGQEPRGIFELGDVVDKPTGIIDLSEAFPQDGMPPPEPRISPRVARLPGVLVGKELVKTIHLYVGQEVQIVSPLGEDTPAGPVPRTRSLRVAGTFFTGMYEYDLKFVYVPLETLQTFLDVGDEVTGIEIRIADPDRTGSVLRDIRAVLADTYRVQDWKEINRSLFAALKLEKIAMFLVLAIIILVASFSIVGNLIMVVVEKAKEIALLKTLGATDGGIVKVFVAQGFFIGAVGVIIGASHGLALCLLSITFGLPLDPEVYYIDRLPIHIEAISVVAVVLAGLGISVVATLYPAVVGAKLRPLEGLRYD